MSKQPKSVHPQYIADEAVVHCENCQYPFVPKAAWQKYCCRGCNQAAYYKRKYETRPRADPLALEPETLKGPSPAQQAEWERRKNLQPPEPSKPTMSPEAKKTFQERVAQFRDPEEVLKELGYNTGVPPGSSEAPQDPSRRIYSNILNKENEDDK